MLSLTRIRFFNLIDTNATTLSTSSTSSDITIFISQTPTARRLLPVEIRIVYNSVLFSEERIDEMFDQITHILDSVTQVRGYLSFIQSIHVSRTLQNKSVI